MKTSIILLFFAVASLIAGGNPHSQTGLWSARTVTSNKSGTTITYPSGEQCAFTLPQAPVGTGPLSFVTTTQVASLLGDLRGKTLTAVLSMPVTGNPRFTYWGEGTSNNQGPFPAHARLFFSNQTGFSTRWGDEVWYSAASVNLSSLAGLRTTLTESLADPSRWGNGQGKNGADHLSGFTATASNVHQIGLAFGGGTFFDVGVAIVQGTGTATLHIETMEAQ